MKSLNIKLRAVEPSDASLMYEWENDRTKWYVSGTTAPMSLFLIEEFTKAENQDIQTTKQLRLIIEETATTYTIGYVDLFDVDFINRKGGVGILIGDSNQRNKGFAKQAIALLKQYCKEVLHLHQLYCNIQEGNVNSIKLFEKSGFEKSGLLKKWTLKNDDYEDVLIMQCFL